MNAVKRKRDNCGVWFAVSFWQTAAGAEQLQLQEVSVNVLDLCRFSAEPSYRRLKTPRSPSFMQTLWRVFQGNPKRNVFHPLAETRQFLFFSAYTSLSFFFCSGNRKWAALLLLRPNLTHSRVSRERLKGRASWPAAWLSDSLAGFWHLLLALLRQLVVAAENFQRFSSLQKKRLIFSKARLHHSRAH